MGRLFPKTSTGGRLGVPTVPVAAAQPNVPSAAAPKKESLGSKVLNFGKEVLDSTGIPDAYNTGKAALEGEALFGKAAIQDPAGVFNSLFRGKELIGKAAATIKQANDAVTKPRKTFAGESTPIRISEPKRVLATGAAIATTFAGAGETAAAKSVAEAGIKKGFLNTAKTLATKETAKRVLADFTLGAVTGGASEAQNPNATPGSIAKSSLESGATFVAVPRVLGAATKAGINIVSKAGQTLSRGIDTAAAKLESKAAPKVIEKGIRFYEGVDKPVETLAQKAAGKTASALRLVQSVPARLSTALDRYAPLGRLAERAKAAGIEAPDLQDMAQATGYRAAGKAENRLDDYIAMRATHGDAWTHVKEVSHYLDDLDRLQNGNKIAGDRSVAQVTQALKQMEQDIGPEAFAAAKKGQADLQTFLNQELQSAVDSGRLSQEGYDAIKTAHPNYIPHDVLDFQDVAKVGMSKNLSLARSGLQRAEGSTREIADIDHAIVDRLSQNNLLNEKNLTMKAFIDTGSALGDESGFIKVGPEHSHLKEPDLKKAGLEKVFYWNNGQREEWLVPKDVGHAIKNIDPNQASAAMNWLNNTPFGKVITAPAKALRNLATSLNPVFSLFRNPLRDVQTAVITSEVAAKDYAFGLAKAIAGPEGADGFYRLARESGALQGSIYREGMSAEELLAQKIKNTRFSGSGSSIGQKAKRAFSKIVRPDKIIESIGQNLEEMTRLSVFKSALGEGKTAQEAAKLARNSTVDFGKSGGMLQVLNKVIPFLNARVQGAANLGRAALENPTQVARKLMWSAALPSAMLTSMNSKYESYQTIPDNEKRKYWIVMTGESDGKDYDNKPTKIPHYLKIPKGEAQQAVANVVERMMTFGTQKYPDPTNKFAEKLLGDFSPVTESSLWPAGVSQYKDLSTNLNNFTGKKIVSDYVKNTMTQAIPGKKNSSVASSTLEPRFRYNETNTSEIAKALGSLLNWSPAKIDYIIRTGALGEIVGGTDLLIKGYKPGGSAFEQASQLPILRGIIGTQAGGEYEQKKNAETQQAIEKNTAKIEQGLERKNNPPVISGGRLGRGRLNN